MVQVDKGLRFDLAAGLEKAPFGDGAFRHFRLMDGFKKIIQFVLQGVF